MVKDLVIFLMLEIFVCRMDLHICLLLCIDKKINIHTCLFFIRRNYVVHTNICHLV